MAGYQRQSAADIVPTAVVRAAPINNELNALRDAFLLAGGHRHDGSATEGNYVTLIADSDALNKVAVDTANNRVGVFVEVAAAAVEQVRVQDGAIVPVTTNDIDLGTSALKFKDVYANGAVAAGTVVATTSITTPSLTASTSAVIASADINAGTIDGTVIGGSSAQAITGTTITASTGFVGGLTGAVTGNTAGTHTGAVIGNVTGDVTGNVTASTGTSTFNDVTINGGLNMDAGTAATITNLTSPTNSGDAATKGYVDTADALKLNLSGGTMSGAIAMGTNKITGLGTPTLTADAATKGYVDTAVSNLIDSAPGALDTLNELAAALGDDASFSTTVTTSIAAKLPLAGGTMSGAIAMGTSKITGLGDPTLAQDAATKTYVDTADALKLNLSGGTMSGAIAMGTSKITGLGNPTANQDAATKTYVDTADALKLSLSGGTMSGAIAMGTSKITGLGTPTDNADATTKLYVDGILGSATAAATSAAAAATSASNAATSESNAATSASNASTSASNASSSATAAAASYDSFDDRYLGPKASAPSVDNDGNALLTGALYWNSTSNELYLWTGSAWTRSALSGTDYVAVTGNQTVAGVKTFTSSPVISVTDNTNAALRITQLGTGNALLVEDATNPDSTPFVVDATGAVVVGATTSSALTVSGAPQLSQGGTTAASSRNAFSRWDASATGFAMQFGKSRSGTVGTFGIVSSGDSFGQLQFFGDDGTAFIQGANITASVDGTPGTNDMPGRLVFNTTADGASSPTERMRIDSTGQTKFSYNAVVEVTDNTNAALRITQLGTGNALVVEDSTNPDSTPFVIDNNGKVIVGATQAYSTTVSGNTYTPVVQINNTSANSPSVGYLAANWATTTGGGSLTFAKSRGGVIGTHAIASSGDDLGLIYFMGSDGTNFIPAAVIVAEVDGTPGTNDMPGRLVFSTTADGASTPTERMRITSAGNVGIGITVPGAKLDISANNEGASNNTLRFTDTDISSQPNQQTGRIEFYTSDSSPGPAGVHSFILGFTENTNGLGALSFGTGQSGSAAERMRIDSSGNVGIGTSSPSGKFHVSGGRAYFAASSEQFGLALKYNAATAGVWLGSPGTDAFTVATEGGTERMRIDSSGNVGIGTSSPTTPLDVKVGTGNFTVGLSGAANTQLTATGALRIDSTGGTLLLQTGGTERARIDSSGNLLVGGTTNSPAGNNVVGAELQALGSLQVSRDGGSALQVNRKTDDGELVAFRQAGTQEGSISVSGTTVSYNGGHLSRWAQTTAPKDDTLVKGTVLSNLDEMNVYTDADGNPVDNEQLNKVKVSDVEGDANVAGVFVNWSHDDAHDVDEINMAMTGDMIIRIAQGTTVARGDLLMSAGNGTAKPQGDDIVRSKTVAKVTSTHVTCTYADGSYCVPCVLMAC